MAKICLNCHRRYNDDATFCSECGFALADVSDNNSENNNGTFTRSEYQQYGNTYTSPCSQNYERLYPAVKTSTYFWLNIAMAIPFVGLILSIVLTCAPQNRSLKNYAKAYLILYLISIGIALIGVILSIAFTGSAVAMFEGSYYGF